MRELVIAIAVAGCGGHAMTPGGAPLTADEIARACENGFACLAPPVASPGVPDCLRRLDDLDTVISMYRTKQIRCLAAAGANCTAAAACLGYAFGPCSPQGAYCDGDRRVECDRTGGLSLDCSGGLWWTDDATCVHTDRIDCGIGTCTAGAPSTCDGARAVVCNPDGILQAYDCAQVGMTCQVDAGHAQCAGAAAACTSSRCEGDRLIRCEGGHEWVTDCAGLLAGGTCVPGGRDGFSCGFGASCTAAPSCTGNTAQLCVLGAPVTIDCVAAGFTRCLDGSCIPASFP